MISLELRNLLSAASDNAKTKYGSEHLSTAHVLLELLNNSRCLEILRTSGGNVEKLKVDVEEAITTLDNETPAKTTFLERLLPPEWSRGFKFDLPLTNEVKNALTQAYNRALIAGLATESPHAHSSRRRDIEPSDLLVAILKDCGPQWTSIFQCYNFAEIDVLFSEAHGMSTTDAANGVTKTQVQAMARSERPTNETLYTVLIHNDDYTTMEFVVEVLISEFQNSWKDAGDANAILMNRKHYC